jgi:hypothetical protein
MVVAVMATTLAAQSLFGFSHCAPPLAASSHFPPPPAPDGRPVGRVHGLVGSCGASAQRHRGGARCGSARQRRGGAGPPRSGLQ